MCAYARITSVDIPQVYVTVASITGDHQTRLTGDRYRVYKQSAVPERAQQLTSLQMAHLLVRLVCIG